MSADELTDSGIDARKLIACHECDLLHRKRPLENGTTAKCTRCGAVLFQERRDSLDHTLALTFTGLILFVVANSFPFMSFELEGRVQQNTLISGVTSFYESGLWGLAILVFVLSIMAPLLNILGMLYVLIPMKLGRRPWKLAQAFRVLDVLHPWGMTEVYLLGVFVAFVKLSDLATIELGIAFYSFAALMVVTAAATAILDPRIVWDRVEAGR